MYTGCALQLMQLRAATCWIFTQAELSHCMHACTCEHTRHDNPDMSTNTARPNGQGSVSVTCDLTALRSQGH